MNRERFIAGLKENPGYSDKQRDNIIKKSIQNCHWKTKCTVAMEELAELQQEISKKIRGSKDKVGLLEEMADLPVSTFCILYHNFPDIPWLPDVPRTR